MGNVCCFGTGGSGGNSRGPAGAQAGSAARQEVQDQLRETAHTLLEEQQQHPQAVDCREEMRDESFESCKRALPPTKLFRGTDQNNSTPAISGSSNGGTQQPKRSSYNAEKMSNLFEKYKEPDQDVIGANGISQLCTDLDIPADDFRILVFAWKCQAKIMCQFSRSEFIEGLSSLGADSIPALVAALDRLSKQLQPLSEDDQYFCLYKWVFTFAPDEDNESGDGAVCTNTQKNRLFIQTAAQLWRVVFPKPNRPPLVDKWLEFLAANADHIGWISRDTWNLFLVLVRRCAHDLSTYDETEAWPSLFDDFVHFHNDQTNQNCAKSSSPWDEYGNGNVISSP